MSALLRQANCEKSCRHSITIFHMKHFWMFCNLASRNMKSPNTKTNTHVRNENTRIFWLFSTSHGWHCWTTPTKKTWIESCIVNQPNRAKISEWFWIITTINQVYWHPFTTIRLSELLAHVGPPACMQYPLHKLGLVWALLVAKSCHGPLQGKAP